MKKTKNKKINIVNQIEKIRSNNNKNWMDLLRLALIKAPKESKLILKKINLCDKKISSLITKLS
tara:strand:- start:261 stop:452 length:192 start_codon:yes stop_codon:yes gene_type:complete